MALMHLKRRKLTIEQVKSIKLGDLIPHFIVKISLTYKTEVLIVQP